MSASRYPKLLGARAIQNPSVDNGSLLGFGQCPNATVKVMGRAVEVLESSALGLPKCGGVP